MHPYNQKPPGQDLHTMCLFTEGKRTTAGPRAGARKGARVIARAGATAGVGTGAVAVLEQELE